MIKAQVFYHRMKHQKQKHNFILSRLTSTGVLTLALLLVAATTFVPGARADHFDDQINALQQQNAGSQGCSHGESSEFHELTSYTVTKVRRASAVVGPPHLRALIRRHPADDPGLYPGHVEKVLIRHG